MQSAALQYKEYILPIPIRTYKYFIEVSWTFQKKVNAEKVIIFRIQLFFYINYFTLFLKVK